MKVSRISAPISQAFHQGTQAQKSFRYSSQPTPVPIFAFIFNCPFWQEPCLSWLVSGVMSHQGDIICWLLKQVITFFFFYDSFFSKSLIYDKSRLDVSTETVSIGLSYVCLGPLCLLYLLGRTMWTSVPLRESYSWKSETATTSQLNRATPEQGWGCRHQRSQWCSH